MMQYVLKDCNSVDIEPLKTDFIEPVTELNTIELFNKTCYSIVDLLPQNNASLVRDSKMAIEILKIVHKIISLLIDSIHKFYISKQYQYFDPHVGDTACQIRAYVFVILSKKKILM